LPRGLLYNINKLVIILINHFANHRSLILSFANADLSTIWPDDQRSALHHKGYRGEMHTPTQIEAPIPAPAEPPTATPVLGQAVTARVVQVHAVEVVQPEESAATQQGPADALVALAVSPVALATHP
jgi:hypothetical protein